MKINSVLGKIDTKQLGAVLMHEHVICCDWSMRMAFREKWFEYDKVVEIAVKQMKKAKEKYGINTIVDGTAVNLGRDIRLIRDVAEKAGMQIIASTGMYFNEEPYLMGKPMNQIINLMLDECHNGIEGTDILPGMIKTATDTYGVTPLNKDLLYMTSIIQKDTNLPVFAHSAAKIKTGLLQQDEFEKNGVKLNRVIIGHSGDSNDLEYLMELMKRGSYIGMDRFGDDGKNSLENRVNTIYELCERGFINQMILSHDFSAYIDWGKNSWKETKEADFENLEVDYTYVHRRAVPLLMKLGLTQKDIDMMMVENPRRIFEDS